MERFRDLQLVTASVVATAHRRVANTLGSQ